MLEGGGVEGCERKHLLSICKRGASSRNVDWCCEVHREHQIYNDYIRQVLREGSCKLYGDSQRGCSCKTDSDK